MTTLPSFEYVNAKDAEETLSQLPADNWADAAIYAGGVDVLDLMKERLYEPKRLVNIKQIGALKFVKNDPEGMHIGPLSTLTEIAENEEIRKTFPALADSCGKAATPQIRNVATIGGNLCQRPRCWYFRSEDFPCKRKGGATCYALEGENRYHAIFTKDQPCVIVHPSAAAVALVALDAKLKIASSEGERMLPLDQFFVLPKENIHRENVLKPNELITEILIPAGARGLLNAYLKQREKQSYDWPLADVAVAAKMDGANVSACRIVLGSAAPVPYRALEAEKFLVGKPMTAENAAKAGELAMAGAEPLAQNGYKVPLFKVIVRRTLMSLTEKGVS